MFSRLKAFIRYIVAPRALPSNYEQGDVESASSYELISDWSNDLQTLEQLQENGMPIPKSLRLEEVFRRLENEPPAHSRESAHKLVKDTLNEVENELTGLPMYHQNRMSFFGLEIDGWNDLDKNPCFINLNSHVAYLYDDGAIKIIRVNDSKCVFKKQGKV